MIKLLLIILFFIPSVNGIRINEIMANPINEDRLNEWVELYNDGDKAINLTSWLIGDLISNDSLIPLNNGFIIPKGYAIIVNNITEFHKNFNISSNATLFYVDSLIGNGLNNLHDTVYLYDKNLTLIDKVSYNKTEEGLSLSYINGSFILTHPTPGYRNMPINCDWEASLIINKSIFYQQELRFKFLAIKNFGPPTKISSTAVIKDFSNNIIKSYKIWSNHWVKKRATSRLYTPNLKPGVYIISINISPSCNDIYKENNFYEKHILINSMPKKKESKIEVSFNPKARFGEIVKLKLDIYKGDTNKRLIKIWISNKTVITPYMRIYVEDKFTNYKITVPLLINPNCNNKYKEGYYTLHIEGLGKKIEEYIKIIGTNKNLCQEKIKYVYKNISNCSTKIINLSGDGCKLVIPETIYLSKFEKIKSFLPHFIVIISTFITTLFVIKKKVL